MPRLSLRSATEHFLIILLGVAVLWKGGKGLEVTWLLPLLALAGSLCQWTNPKKNSVPAVAWPFWLSAVLFGAWTVASFFWSETRNYGLDEVIRDISLLLIWLQLIRLAPAPREALAARLIDALVYSVLFASLLGVFVYVFQPVGRFVGSFFDPRYHTDFWPNAWAELILLAWPFLLYKVLQAEKNWRFLWALFGGLVVGTLFLSYSRGGVIALIGQLILLAVLAAWLVPKKRWDLRGTALLAATTIVVAVGMFFVGNALRGVFYPVQDLGAKVTFTADEGTSSIDERKDFWKQSWRLSFDRPLIGHGPYSFRFLQPRLQTAVYATADHPHNLWLKMAMERGWPAAVLLTIILVLSLGTAFRRASRDDGLTWPVLGALGIIGVLAHVLIDFNLQFVGIALPFWMFLGLIAAPVSWPKAPARVPMLQNGFELFVVLLLTCVTVREAAYLVTSSLGRKAEMHGDRVTAETWYQASEDSWFARDLELGRAALALQDGQSEVANAALNTYFHENAQDARAFSLRAAIEEHLEQHVLAAKDLKQAFDWSKYNDLKVLKRWIVLSQNDHSVVPLPKADVQKVFAAFEKAFEEDSHFILLGDNVEEFSTICWLEETNDEEGLRDLCHQKLDTVMAKAKAIRSTLDSRKRGRLW